MKGVQGQFLFKGTESWAKCDEIVMTWKKNLWKFTVASMSGKNRKLIADHPWMHEESIKILQVEDTWDSKTLLAHIFLTDYGNMHVWKGLRAGQLKTKDLNWVCSCHFKPGGNGTIYLKWWKGRACNQEYSTQQDSHSHLMEKSKAFQTSKN